MYFTRLCTLLTFWVYTPLLYQNLTFTPMVGRHQFSLRKQILVTAFFSIVPKSSDFSGFKVHSTKLQKELYCHEAAHMSPAKRVCVFEHSVLTNFNCACPAIQRGHGSGFLSEGSSGHTACMSEQRRFWRDCADAQARLNLCCSHKR